MRKTTIWIVTTLMLLGMVFAQAEGNKTALQKTNPVQTLQLGDQGEQVARIQGFLSELHYFTGEPSGLFEESTQLAVKSFQKDYGLQQTGIADSQTLGLLYATKYPPLEKGSTGEDVKALQSRLTQLLYYHGKISGNYLVGTYSAISDFQQKNGLIVTGKADPITQELLFNEEKALAKTAKALPSPTPTPLIIPTPIANSPTENAPQAEIDVVSPTPAPTDLAFTKVLSKGAKGDKVSLLQMKLTELGFYKDAITGIYTAETKTAVIEFQKHNGQAVDGITGKNTWNLLFNSTDALAASATPRPTPTPTPVAYAITIDVTNQVVTAYGLDENNEYTKVVRQMICSTGTWATPSDVGVWKMGEYRARFPLFTKYGVYVQYWTPIVNGIGFHSVIYNTKNTMDLAVGSYNQLGNRVSHGCIRMLVDDAKWIYENAVKGTMVTITESLPSDPELNRSLRPAPLNRRNMLPQVTPEPTPFPEYNGSQPPPMPIRTLSNGKKGEDVYWLQMKLKELGLYTGTVTGGYYGGTAKAVKLYQKANGLSADGVAGIKTQTKLYADVLPTPTPDVIPTPAPKK